MVIVNRINLLHPTPYQTTPPSPKLTSSGLGGGLGDLYHGFNYNHKASDRNQSKCVNERRALINTSPTCGCGAIPIYLYATLTYSGLKPRLVSLWLSVMGHNAALLPGTVTLSQRPST